MDAIETYSLIVKDLAKVPYDRPVSSLVKDLTELGWSKVHSMPPVFSKLINNEVWQLYYDKDTCLRDVRSLSWTEKAMDFFSWAGEVYYDIAFNGIAALMYPAPEEIFCDQVAVAVLRYWIPKQRPKPLLVQEVHKSFEKFSIHTGFTNLKQIRKVLCMLATRSFEPFPERSIPLEKAYLQADVDSNIDDVYTTYSGWVESMYTRPNLSFISIQMLKYMRDSWFIPEDCGECLRLLSLM